MIDSHSLWVFIHILLFVFWLGADVGVYTVMVFVKNPAHSYETRKTLIRMAFIIDLFPRTCMALMTPVGLHMVHALGIYDVSLAMQVSAWVLGIAWAASHIGIVVLTGPIVKRLVRVGIFFEASVGLLFVVIGVGALVLDSPTLDNWFAVKLLLFGLVFWNVLGIDTTFKPLTMILTLGPDGSTPEKEAAITRETHLTMAWALMLYVMIAVIVFMGTTKPF